MSLSLFKEDDDHVSSAEDMSRLLDGDENVEDDDDIVFISDRNSRLEISGFEDLGDGAGGSGQQQQAPNPNRASMPFKSLVSASSDYFRSFEEAFLRGSEAFAVIKNEMIRGRLKTGYPHRNVLWAAIGRNLSPDPERWPEEVAKKRHEYEVYKSSHFSDERGNRHMDPAVNNPLSQDVNSPWNKFFSDNDLMKDIERDVVRTLPGDPVFREERTRKMMKTMLFIYAKRVPQMGYKQGMHELLATAIKVQMDCCREFQRATDSKQPPSDFGPNLPHKVLKCIQDSRYIEHDAYFLFDYIMLNVWEWYFVATSTGINGARARTNVITVEATEQRLFSGDNHGDDDLCGAAQRLQRVWDNVLGTHDPKLYNHLNSNLVLPTTFGTNWTKLLFSRQFKDYVVVWDAVIASGFTLVDFLVVAMIISIKRLLLTGDSIRCNQLLVSKYPDSVDVRHVISLALHIHEPMRYNRPGGSSFKVGTKWFQDVTSMKGKAAGSGSSSKRNGNLKLSTSSSGNSGPPHRTILEIHPETEMVDVGDRKALSGAEMMMTNAAGLPAYFASSTPDNGFEVLGRELPQSPTALVNMRRRMRIMQDQRQEFLDSAAGWAGKLSAVVGILSNQDGKECANVECANVGQARRSLEEVRDFIQDVVSTAKDDEECDDEDEDDDEGLETRRPDLLRLDASVAYDVLDELETGHM